MDVAEPGAQVARVTRFVREVWSVPPEFVCFSSVEGEGAYLYSTRNQSVWDFSLASSEDFADGNAPNWPGFFAFMRWYLE